MTIKVFSIFDSKASCFGQPFYMANDALARRAFGDLAKDATSNVSRHPDDFKLYCLGAFDDCAGKFDSLSQPDFLNTGSDFVTN